MSFQFIGFPSEWGASLSANTLVKVYRAVSNLLGSPASGETSGLDIPLTSFGFPIYWVPQRVGSWLDMACEGKTLKFPIYWVPQRVGSLLSLGALRAPQRFSFQFIGFPSEWGGHYRKAPRLGGNGFQFIGFPSEWGAPAKDGSFPP